MSYFFPEGAKFYFSNTLAAAKTVTAVSNASPAVATSVAHGYADNDEVLFTSGWEDASNSVFKVDQLTADSFGILGLNSVNTQFYPANTGTGTTQKVSNWTEIPQVLSIATSGGDARFTDVQPLSLRNAIKIPTGFNAMSIDLTLAHDASNANYQSILEISRGLGKVAFKLVLGGGATAYGYGYMNVSEAPSMQSNQVNQVRCSLALIGRFMSYAS